MHYAARKRPHDPRRIQVTSPDPPAAGGEPEQALLRTPLRIVQAAMGAALAVAAVLNFAYGVATTGLAAAVGTVAIVVGWRMASAGRTGLAAVLTFYVIAAVLAALVYVGHGSRDYGLIAIPAVVFAASIFLQPRAYWTLAGAVLAGVVILAVAEASGAYHPLPAPVTGVREAVNLVLIVCVSAIGGRGLMHAVHSASAREKELSGALRSSRERIEKLFRSSHNPIVVSRLEDGLSYEVNDAYLELFGFAREQVIGHKAVDMRVWEDPLERDRFVRIMRERGAVREFEARMRKRSGEIIEVRLSAELIDLDGEPCLLVYVTDVTAQREAERRAEFLATRDALTGLPSRVVVLDRLRHAIQRTSASGGAIAVLHLDIDRFTTVNESLGYEAGDALIRQVAGRIEAIAAPGDTLARIAGDEFVYIAESLERPEDAAAVAERVIGEFQRPFVVDGRELRVTASAGVCVGPDYADDAESLLRRADTAMHRSKQEGRGRYRLYDKSMSERVRDRLFVESSLRAGIARGELRLAYQPKFHLGTREVTGLEALVRWRHPELGDVAPSTFIPIAEESDLIHELGAWVLGEACGQIARWESMGLACVPVAVNLSAPQFTSDLPRLVAEATRAHGLSPGLIELEVTESLLIKSPSTARRLLQQIAARGTRIVLDDFGVGYSSLSYVKELDIHGIKIDRSFVRDLAGSRHDGAIVRAIVGLARGLGLGVVGEGIEFEAQADLLVQLGCDEGQGFYFSRPVGGEEIAAKFLAPRHRSGMLAG